MTDDDWPYFTVNFQKEQQSWICMSRKLGPEIANARTSECLYLALL